MQPIEVQPGVPGVRAAFTTRTGGVSTGGFAGMNLGATTGDAPETVRANRMAAARALGFDAHRAVVLDQVHGAEVVTIGPMGGDGGFCGALEGAARADACTTDAPGVALMALGADCPAVLMWDAAGSWVGAVHAGWRGLVAGVVEAGVAAMQCDAGDVRAAVGPRVGPCCYPVDDAVRGAIASRFGEAVLHGDAVDLGATCVAALAAAGVPASAIEVIPACTACEAASFYSYRRDGVATGRHAGVVWLDEAGR